MHSFSFLLLLCISILTLLPSCVVQSQSPTLPPAFASPAVRRVALVDALSSSEFQKSILYNLGYNAAAQNSDSTSNLANFNLVPFTTAVSDPNSQFVVYGETYTCTAGQQCSFTYMPPPPPQSPFYYLTSKSVSISPSRRLAVIGKCRGLLRHRVSPSAAMDRCEMSTIFYQLQRRMSISSIYGLQITNTNCVWLRKEQTISHFY